MSGPCGISRFSLYMGIFWIIVAVVLGAVEVAFGDPWTLGMCAVTLTVGIGQVWLYLDQAQMARQIRERRL